MVTEDPTLRKYLQAVIDQLKEAHMVAVSKKKASIKLSVRHDFKQYKRLLGYCEKVINSSKPQWQITAEQHGWAPSSKKNG